MGSIGQGVSEIGDLKVLKYFENFPLLNRAGFYISRFSHRKYHAQSERLIGFRQATSHSKRIAKGYRTAMLYSRSVEDLDLEKVKCRFVGKVFNTLTANIS